MTDARRKQIAELLEKTAGALKKAASEVRVSGNGARFTIDLRALDKLARGGGTRGRR